MTAAMFLGPRARSARAARNRSVVVGRPSVEGQDDFKSYSNVLRVMLSRRNTQHTHVAVFGDVFFLGRTLPDTEPLHHRRRSSN